MARRRDLLQTAPIPSLLIATKDGTVVAQNQPARRLMGDGRGRACWNVVGQTPDAEGLPCAQDCVRRNQRNRLDEARHTSVLINGKRHILTCVPVKNTTVCMLSASTIRTAASWQVLTRREVEVLRLLAEGATTIEAANRLDISAATVRTHVENMRNKLGAATRASLVALGFRLGFLD
jgi:DNA-binding CsgD family transcriptional regulator